MYRGFLDVSNINYFLMFSACTYFYYRLDKLYRCNLLLLKKFQDFFVQFYKNNTYKKIC